MADNENAADAPQGGAFIADRHRNPAEMVVKTGSSGDIWAGIVAIVAFLAFAAVAAILYLDMGGLTGV